MPLEFLGNHAVFGGGTDGETPAIHSLKSEGFDDLIDQQRAFFATETARRRRLGSS